MKYLSCFLLLIAAPITLSAGDLTLFAGFQSPGELSLNPSDAASDVVSAFGNPQKAGVFGVRLNTFGGPIGFEHTVAFAPNFIESESQGFIYNSNLLVQVPLLPVRPYGTVGLGLVHSSGDGPAVFGTKFGFNYGGGVKFPLAGPVGGRVDLRGYSVRGIFDENLNLFEASFGLVLGF